MSASGQILLQPDDKNARLKWLWLWDTALAGITFALVAPPLMTSRLIYNHDLNHLFRIVYAEDALRQGLWSWRWIPSMGQGFGYPLFNYYAPAAVYLSVALKLLTGNIALAYGLTGLCALGFGWIGMWLWVRSRWSPEAAAPAAILYTVAPYHLLDIYVRGACSEALAMGIFPAVLWCGERAWRAGKKRYLVAGGALWALVVLSHNISAMVFAALLLIYFGAVSLGEKSARPAVGGVILFALGTGLSAFFWLPALAELDAVHISRLTADQYAFRDHFVYFHQLFRRSWGWGHSIPGPTDTMSFQIGWPHVLILVASAALYLAPARLLPRADWWWTAFWQLAAGTSILLMLNLSTGLWTVLRPIQLLQFPWRLLTVVVLAASALVAPLLHAILSRFRWPAGVLVVMAAMIVYFPCYRSPLYVDQTRARVLPQLLFVAVLQSSPDPNAATTTSNGEYFPQAIEELPTSPPVAEYVADPQVQVTDFTRRGNRYRFRLRLDTPGRVVLNQFYFPGWRAAWNGKRIPIQVTGPQGTMALQLPPGEGRLDVWFGSTPWRLAGRLLTGLTVIVTILWLLATRFSFVTKHLTPATAPRQ